MKNNYRKILFVFVTACFVLTTTNAVFALHLAEHDEDQQHDDENCPICQQATINKKSAVLSSSAEICSINVIIFTVSYEVEISLQTAKFQLPQLRAPPSISWCFVN
ncbi:MAG: hypothetical protein KAS23_09350 [Anaerohalosphaera sp.]|nr:hypothetical protein [Anaerohalosphaera sp.]